MEQDHGEPTKPLFRDINAEDDEIEKTEVESLCMNCHEQGTTKLLLTRIPYFRDLIISSFRCPHCGIANNEFQSASAVQTKGVKIALNVDPSKDLNRQVVKSETTTIIIPELDFEIPPESQKGIVSTVEGVIDRAVAGLKQEQPLRKALDPETADKINKFIDNLSSLKTQKTPFKFVLNDPAGNCFLENPFAPNDDHQMTIIKYIRTQEQNEALGLRPEDSPQEVAPDEVLQFKTNCPQCNAPVNTNMKMVDIPHFKQIIVMATNCDACGERTNEIKSGTGFEAKGRKITLNVTDISDMSRDVLKSETCRVEIPELKFEVGGHAISGKFTTVEGLLTDIYDLLTKTNPFTAGDSAGSNIGQKVKDFGEKIEKLKNGTEKFTLILDDPVGNSYLQNVYAPEEDPEMKTEEYERTSEQNEDLGLNDMKTENY